MTTAVHHVGIVVHNIDDALGFYGTALGLDVSERRDEPDEGVEIAVLPVGEGAIELIRPLGDGGGVARFLEKRGEGIHHICLAVKDIGATMARLRSAGVQLLSEEPITGVGGARRCFIHPRSAHGVLVELCEP